MAAFVAPLDLARRSVSANLCTEAGESKAGSISKKLQLKAEFTGMALSLKTSSATFQRKGGNSITCTATAPAPAKAAPLPSLEADRVYNFAAGPAILPLNVLKEAQAELLNYRGSGTSVMEMSHRSKEFLSIVRKAEADLRALLAIPDDYAVLFMQGGATTQFAAVPLNLCAPGDAADFVVTGSWGDKAFKEAKKYSAANLAASGKAGKYTDIPPRAEWQLTPGAKYVHICANETIQGVEFKEYPDVGDALLVADMSSNFCSKPVDVSKFGLIYAGAQKNVGPSGVTTVIVRKDLLAKAQASTPVMLDYQTQAENESLYNTPPCFAIYICGLVYADLLAQGGLAAVAKKNEEKAGLLYQAIDESNGFYKCPVAPAVRSLMNVPFTMATPELEAEFLKEATAQGMVQLKGHRSVGGVRASIYNAMPLEGVKALVALMKDFQSKH